MELVSYKIIKPLDENKILIDLNKIKKKGLRILTFKSKYCILKNNRIYSDCYVPLLCDTPFIILDIDDIVTDLFLNSFQFYYKYDNR